MALEAGIHLRGYRLGLSAHRSFDPEAARIDAVASISVRAVNGIITAGSETISDMEPFLSCLEQSSLMVTLASIAASQPSSV